MRDTCGIAADVKTGPGSDHVPVAWATAWPRLWSADFNLDDLRVRGNPHWKLYLDNPLYMCIFI